MSPELMGRTALHVAASQGVSASINIEAGSELVSYEEGKWSRHVDIFHVPSVPHHPPIVSSTRGENSVSRQRCKLMCVV